MADELNTASAPISEQPSPEGPSQQGATAESSPAPAAEVMAPEKPAVDIESIRKQALDEARERARHELQSEYGKQLSETKRKAQEAARLEREQLLAGLSDFVPDSQLEAMRSQYTARQQAQAQAEEVAEVKARLSAYEQSAQFQQAVQKATIRAERAGYKIEDLPPDVRGDGPSGFEDRFVDFLAEENKKLKKQLEKDVKKAAEEATRETERKLGVTTVAGSAPVGAGRSDLNTLQSKLRAAHDRGDSTAIRELGQQIEEAVYRK